MSASALRGTGYITLLNWSKEEVQTVLDVGLDLKRPHAVGECHDHIYAQDRCL
jgi:hypothetical protein